MEITIIAVAAGRWGRAINDALKNARIKRSTFHVLYAVAHDEAADPPFVDDFGTMYWKGTRSEIFRGHDPFTNKSEVKR